MSQLIISILSLIKREKSISSSTKITNGQIFSKKLDIPILFIIPTIALIAFYLAEPFFKEKIFFYSMFAVYVVLGIGHGAGTFIPITFSIKNKTISLQKTLFIFFGILLFSVSLFFISHKLFFTGYIIYLAIHHVRQKVGFVQVSEKRAQKQTRLIDELMIYNVCGIPLLAHLISSETFLKLVFPQTMVFQFPAIPENILFTFFWIFNALYVGDQILNFKKTREVNLTKYYMIINGFLCFYVSYLLIPNIMFFVSLPVHGLNYLLFTFFTLNKESQNLKTQDSSFSSFILNILKKNFFIYSLISIPLGLLITSGIYVFTLNPQIPASYVWLLKITLAVSYSVIVTHFFFDSFIWKRKFRKNSH